MSIYRYFVVLFILGLVACRDVGPAPAPATPTAVSATVSPTAVFASPVPSPTPTPQPPTATPTLAAPPTWPPAPTAESPFGRTAVSAAEQAAFDELNQSAPPERDDLRLAAAYRGMVEQPTPAPLVTEPLPVGTTQTFNIANFDDNTVVPIETVLLAVGNHAYFWFDTGPGSYQPNEVELAEVTAEFDTYYETNNFYFGSENNPGIDGDPRVYVVHASPLSLCNVSLSNAANCPLAGYFSSRDVLPKTADSTSNAHEMFVMNVSNFGTSFYLNVLGHEFRHMIEDNYDQNDYDWEVEGSAILAEELIGHPSTGQQRGNLFLQNPDQQLNSWTDGNSIPYYGQGYVMNRYIFDRLGIDLYREFATHPANGLLAVDAVAAAHGLDITGHSLWLDWLAALAIHDDPNAPDIYQFQGVPLDTADSSTISRLPDTTQTTVSQYAADYYTLPNNGTLTLQFTGNALVQLLDTVPASGQSMWYAQRANYSNPRLTRQVDLQQVAAATLNYLVYTDIEYGYDYAYVSVSTDGGQTWQGLTAENMQGLDPADNPSGSALTERFYTGRSEEWVQETADLTPYAGQIIQLRFEYVTDPILTFGGFALDNISIPEIGFYDSAETLAEGWVAEGFTRTTGYLPQTWHVQLITFPGGVPTVQQLPLNADQTVSYTFDGAESGEKRPILIIAATAPMTLEKAHYQLTVSSDG